jgi:hypothetical protein
MYITIPLESKHLNWLAHVDIVHMGKIRVARHNAGLIYRSFTVKDTHILSERHESFNPLNLPINKFIN